MKFKWIYVLLCILGSFVIGCSNDEEGIKLEIPISKMEFPAAGKSDSVEVKTDEMLWGVTSTVDWVYISQTREKLYLKVGCNPTRNIRTGKVYVNAGGQYVRIDISQEGSIRSIGEPYPDAQNPIGIIYHLEEGGKHGKIVSFKQTTIQYATKSTSDGATSLTDGAENTKIVMEKYQNDSTFTTNYPAYAWVRDSLNGGDVNGAWFLPSVHELHVMIYTMLGMDVQPLLDSDPNSISYYCTLEVPETRAMFDDRLTEYGGDAMSWFESDVIHGYLASTEYNSSYIRGARLYSTQYRWSKSGLFYVRAIQAF